MYINGRNRKDSFASDHYLRMLLGFTLQQGKFRLATRKKNPLKLMILIHWNRLPGEIL